MLSKTHIAQGTKFGRYTVIGEGETRVEKNGRKRKTLIVKCDCGTIKTIIKDVITRGHTKSCGCLHKEIVYKFGKEIGYKFLGKGRGWNKGLYGKNNPNYKGNTPLLMNIRNSIEYKNWRTKCFERDNYTCQISGITKSGKMVVHHLKPMYIIVDDLDIYNYRDNNELFDINNGITLTKDIHDEFHKKYGKKNFTIENFYEFKNNKILTINNK